MNRLFDLEKALQGHPVVLRNGKKAYVRHYEKELDALFPLIGYIVNDRGKVEDVCSWKDNGPNVKGAYPNLEDGTDIVGMWQEPVKTKVINGHKVPDISFTPKKGEGYYFPELSYDRMVSSSEWRESSLDLNRLERGLIYPLSTEGEEAAIAHAKALLSPKTCYSCFIDTFTDYVLGRGYGCLGECIELAETSYEGYNKDMSIPDYAEEVLNEIARGV